MKHMRRIASAMAAVVLATAGISAATPTTADIIDQVRRVVAPDCRVAVYELQPSPEGAITGQVSEAYMLDSLQAAIDRAGLRIDLSGITVLPSDQWALASLSVGSVRHAPAHAAELDTQVLMGMPLRVLESDGEWLRVQCPDTYIGYLPSSSAVRVTPDELQQWRNSHRYVVTAPYQVRAYSASDLSGYRDVVSDLVLGNILVADADAVPVNGRLLLTLPDGRQGWVDESSVTTIEQWAARGFDPELILDVAYSMEGQPYLWGGTSTKMLDCSGLAKVSYLASGIILMRDASQQALTGLHIDPADWPTCQAGDLLFFGTRSGRVTHVAIYDHDGNYVHSSGRVKRNSVDPDSPAYLTTPFLGASRIHGYEGTKGIVRAADHPWYFNK